MLETFQDQVRMAVRAFPFAAVHGKDTSVAGHLLDLNNFCNLECTNLKMSEVLYLQGIKAVVTLNEEFEVFISTRQYQAGSTPCKLLLAPLLALGITQTLLQM